MNTSNKNFMTEDKSTEFKVPISRKRSAFQPVESSAKNSKDLAHVQKREKVFNRQRMRLLGLIMKLVDNPQSLSKGDKITLMNHPIVKDLMKYSKVNNWGPGNFYVPIESLVEAIFQKSPSPYEDESKSAVEVLFQKSQEQESSNCLTTKTNHFLTDKKDFPNLNSNGSFFSNNKSGDKVGHYTKAERKEKIMKYRQKVRRWLLRKKNNSLMGEKQKVLRRREKARSDLKHKQGFNYSDYDVSLLKNGTIQSQSWCQEFLANFESLPPNANLNEIVAQISGIN